MIFVLQVVGMAATLAGVCQVPLTAVLLLFELTHDYRIVLPLLGAVGLSSWITSGQTNRTDRNRKKLEEANTHATIQPEISSCNLNEVSSTSARAAMPSYANNLCKIESSLCIDDSNDDVEEFESQILVSQAMRTRYVTVMLGTSLREAVNLMLAEKQSCALIVNEDCHLIDLLTLGDIQEFSKSSKAENRSVQEVLVSEVCSLNGQKHRVLWTVTPAMSVISAQILMNRHGVSQLPVIMDDVGDQRVMHVGLIDKECISLACRVIAIRECLSEFTREKQG